METLIIDNKYDGKKLNNVLLNEFPALSTNSIYKALRKKDIRINDVKIKENVVVHLGDEIKIFISNENLYNTSNFHVSKVYEDNNILIINKPTDVEVTGDNSLTTILSSMYKQSIYPCHRLDRNTTGLVIFAKNEKAQNILFNKFKNHEIEKHYIARIYGMPKEKHKLLKAYLFKDNKKSIVYISDTFKKGYQNIITEYSIISKNSTNNTCILDVTLHTGRTHQIRAHLSHIGYPIIGDSKYGINKINKKFRSKTQNLCSYKLKFNFTTSSDILDYLHEKEITLNDLPKYFK